jgi:hypothetical protein
MAKKQAVPSIMRQEVDRVKVLGLVSGLVLGIQTTVCAGVVFHVETTFPNRTEIPSRTDEMTVDGKKQLGSSG